MTLSDKKRSEIWRTDAGVLVVRATGVPRQTHECRAHRLVVHEERAHGLLDGRLIDRGFGGLQGQADTGADHGGGASCARQDGSHIETRSHCPGNSNHSVLDMLRICSVRTPPPPSNPPPSAREQGERCADSSQATRSCVRTANRSEGAHEHRWGVYSLCLLASSPSLGCTASTVLTVVQSEAELRWRDSFFYGSTGLHTHPLILRESH